MTQSDLLSSIFRQEVLAINAYKVADASGMIKLDAMENPYNWPKDIENEWLATLKDCQLNRYPDPMAHELTKSIRLYDKIPAEFAVLLGNGSDEIIQLLLMVLPIDACVMSPTPSFVMYEQISRSLGLNYQGVPLLKDGFELDLPRMLAAINEYQPSVIFLSYPNNPTGNLFSETSIRKIMEESKGLVVIDEAYSPFAKTSFINALGQNHRLLIMRTLSKIGLAGLRLGYIAGNPDIIEQLNKIRLPYNINILTQLTATVALSHSDMFEQQTEIICRERTRIFNQLKLLEDFSPYPSATNFILFRTPRNQADAIFTSLKQQGVLIKNLSPQGGLLTDCLRVTIGKPEENDAFLFALTNNGCTK